jgi:hypothetical protein
MKRFWATAACAAALTMAAGCGAREDRAPEVAAPPTTAAETGSAVDDAAAQAPAQPVAPGAPAFAVVYPGGTVEDEPVFASGPDGPGGLVTYLTDAAPEAVIAFHRERAEAAGLSSVMAMNQGEARAYGAAKAKANLQVVAAPTPEGLTSVQLSWSAAG